MIHKVARLASVNPESFMMRHVLGSMPLVVEDAVKDSPAYDRWTFDYIIAAEGDREVRVEFWEDGNTGGLANFHRMKLSEYIDIHRTSPSKRKQYYFAEWPVQRELPSLWTDVPTPALIRQIVPHVESTGFIGVDTFTSIHYHPNKQRRYLSSQSFLTQLCGSKRVLLCRPRDYRKLDYFRWYKALHNQSAERDLHVGGPDVLIEKISRAGADVWDCVLKPGEGLFIPAHWHHAVFGIGENISVTYWWHGPGPAVDKLLFTRDMFALAAKTVVTRPLEQLAKNPKYRKAVLHVAAALGVIDRRDVMVAAERIKESDPHLEQDGRVAYVPPSTKPGSPQAH